MANAGVAQTGDSGHPATQQSAGTAPMTTLTRVAERDEAADRASLNGPLAAASGPFSRATHANPVKLGFRGMACAERTVASRLTGLA